MTQKLLALLKYSLVTVNLFFVATGILTLYVGITAQWIYDMYSYFWYPGFLLPGFCIATGVLILLIAAIGFYGAIKENYLINMLFAGTMFIVLIFQVSICIAGFAIREDLMDSVPRIMTWAMSYYDHSTDITSLWDNIQQDFECCGIRNASDWLMTLNTQDTLSVPLSCCGLDYGSMQNCTLDSAFERGCATPFGFFIDAKMNSIGDVGVFLTLMQGLITVNVVSALWMVRVASA